MFFCSVVQTGEDLFDLPCDENLEGGANACNASNSFMHFNRWEDKVRWKCNKCKNKFINVFSECPTCGSEDARYLGDS